MEKSSSSEKEPETLFFCHLCSVSCASALNLQSHFLGLKHRKSEEALRTTKIEQDQDNDEEEVEVKPETLQEQIDACKNSEPALGLEYIYQYRKRGYNIYECKLCHCRAGLTHMFMHIVGAKHRMNYLGKHHPKLGICGPYIMKGPKKLKKLRDICLNVEKEFGRQKINILDGTDRKWTLNTENSGVRYTPDSELEKMYFTSDDVFDTDCKPKAEPEHVVTFLELKAAYEADQKTASSDDIENNTESEDKNSESKVEDTGGESEKDTNEKEVPNEEPCDSDEDFANNKDLLDFLEHFRILEEGDAKFVVTVVEMLSIALLRHKKGLKKNEEKLMSMSTSHEQGNCEKPDPAPSILQFSTNQEYSSTSKEMLSADPTLSNQASTAATPDQTLDPERQTETQLFPIPQPGERKKLKFTFSSNKTQESALKLNQRPETLGATTTFKTKTNVFGEDENEDTPAKSRLSQKIPVSQLGNRRPSGESQPSSSHVSDSKLPYEVQQHHGLQGDVNSSVRNMTQVQPQVFPAPQVNRGAPSPEIRFPPPRAPFPPRAAPPLFPIANNDVVNKFFESIKNMEVDEVTSTLNKITATNPAFKGMHVPSLVRYLTETGKLKSTQSVQQLNQ